MKSMTEENLKIIVYDIETLCEMFLYMGYDPVEDKWYTFEISKRKNDIYALGKFLDDFEDYYFVGFNNVRFDAQVVEYISRRYKRWYDLSVQEIIDKIYIKSQDIIDDINHGLFPPYREESLSHKQIDLFLINHLDNKSRMTSLKWIEFMADVANIEEMPYKHYQTGLTDNQLQEIVDYCRNDITSTYVFYLYTRGRVDHSFYKGEDKIQDRLDIIEEMDFPEKAINFSDVKIGDENNKRGYLEMTGKTVKDLYTLKKNRKSNAGFSFGDCIPKYVKFETPEFNKFYESVKDVRVNLNQKQEFPFTYNGTKYTIAKGGIHSNEKNRIIKPLANEVLVDADVGSQYPNAIRKRNLFPSHLGIKWLTHYVNVIFQRLKFKAEGKTNPKAKSKAKGLKLSLNGGGFGKTNENTNWQYDPFVMYRCTIGNQFEILMLIEMLELSGIHCVSANTDGIVCLFNKEKEDKYYEICHRWEKIVGNEELGKLEYTYYTKLVQESVNHYIAVEEGGFKVKGRFDYEVELNKNNTSGIGRIERKALQQYFVNDIPIRDTITKCTDIFMFCIGMKASRDYHYRTVNNHNKVTDYQRIVRFFVSNDGVRLWKIKNETSTATGPEKSKVCGENKVTMFNQSYTPNNFKDYDIDYEFYITRAQEIIDKIERGGKKKGKPVSTLQTFFDFG